MRVIQKDTGAADADRNHGNGKSGVMLQFRRFIEDRRGAGAVEFAIIAPLLIMAYIGAFEISLAMTVSRKVSRASSTVSDLLTQTTSTDKAALDTMKVVATNILAPFAAGAYSLKITGITVDKDGKANVAWSRDQNASAPYAKGSVVTLPSDMEAKDTFIVRTEFSVPHAILLMMPGLSASSLNSLNLSKTSYFRQRVGSAVECADCT
jgi:Flp pilus assembly protein TadG